MPPKQTRRSVSVSGPTYARLSLYGKQRKRSLSSLVEEALKVMLSGTLASDSALTEDDLHTISQMYAGQLPCKLVGEIRKLTAVVEQIQEDARGGALHIISLCRNALRSDR